MQGAPKVPCNKRSRARDGKPSVLGTAGEAEDRWRLDRRCGRSALFASRWRACRVQRVQ